MLRIIPNGASIARATWRSSIIHRPPRVTAFTTFPRVSFSTSVLRYNEHRNLKQVSPQLKTSKHEKPIASIQPPTPPTGPELKVSSDLYTIPNILTMSRIFATPFIGYFITTGQSTAAISVFVYSCVTDALDGFIARKYNMKSVLGSILDPAADKFLMTVCTVALGIKQIMPWYVAAIIIGRDVMLSFMAFYFRYKSLPVPKTLARFLDMSIVTHTVHPNLLGKVNTALQMFYVGGLVLLPGVNYVFGADQMLAEAFDWFGIVVAMTTFASGASYVLSRNAIKTIR